MKRRIAAAGLALALLLPCRALAFSDVPEGAWYADSVALCVEKSLLQGTGSDTFSPEGAVTLAEVMTVAARLHYSASGGQGDLPQAPEDWGTGAITTPAGAPLLRFDTCDLDRDLTYRFDTESPQLGLHRLQQGALRLPPRPGHREVVPQRPVVRPGARPAGQPAGGGRL